MKRIITGLLLIASVTGAAYWLRPRPVPVELARAERHTVREYVTEDATTRLSKVYTIDMPVAGTLAHIDLDEGARVQEGQTVARVDPFDLEQEIRAAEAAIGQAKARIAGVDATKPKAEDIAAAQAQADGLADTVTMATRGLAAVRINYENARKEYERLTTLRASNAVSQSAYDNAKRAFEELAQEVQRQESALAAARKNYESARLQAESVAGSVDDNEYLRRMGEEEIAAGQALLARLRNDLSKTDIGAPVSGVVLDKFTEGGVVLPPGAPIMTVGRLEDVEIESDILSEEVVLVNVGDPVEITGKAVNDATIAGSVKRIHPSGFKKISALGIEQQRVRVIIGFDNAPLGLRPGTSVDAHIVTAEKAETISVPERATFRRADQWHVFVVRDGCAVLTPVTLGVRNDQWAEVLDGINEGDLVIAEPTNDLEDGAAVTETE